MPRGGMNAHENPLTGIPTDLPQEARVTATTMSPPQKETRVP